MAAFRQQYASARLAGATVVFGGRRIAALLDPCGVFGCGRMPVAVGIDLLPGMRLRAGRRRRRVFACRDSGGPA
jgi:hypothetical protein